MLAPPTKASQTADALPLTTFGLPPLAGEMSEGQRGNAPNPGCSGENRNPEGVARGNLSVQGSGERSPYPAHVFPHRRAEEATAPARGMNRAMTGAPLSNASRRADGLATSAVLDQKYLPHAIETTRRCFKKQSSPFCVSKRGTRKRSERRGCPYPDQGVPVPRYG